MPTPQRFRAILLDAVGTTIYPAKDVSRTYAEYGRRHGSALNADAIRGRFRETFRRQEELDRAHGHATSEPRERERWRAIVGDVFLDVENLDRLFQELWEHFASPGAWRAFPDVGPFLAAAGERGIQVILASNFDARLRGIVPGLPDLQGVSGIAISSEIGWKKPSREFYRHILSEWGLAPQEVLAVGDDRTNDYDGARAAGMTSYLVDRSVQSGGEFSVRSLDQLIPMLG